METIQIHGVKRENFGKKGSKDVRRNGLIPAIVYGGSEEAVHFALDEKELKPLLYTPNSYIVELDIDGTKQLAVLREQGVNSHVELAAAFTRAGFDVYDVHMTDLLSGRTTLEEFCGLGVAGGFSYGDVLGAGSGHRKNEAEQAAAKAAPARKTSFFLM